MTYIPADEEIEFVAIRAQGPGGQNVNKVSNAVQLRFDVANSRMPQELKDRLVAVADSRITRQGIIVIKAQGTRSQEQNKAEARARLLLLIAEAAHVPTVRRPTKPTYGSKRRRLEAKSVRSEIKVGRGKVVI